MDATARSLLDSWDRQAGIVASLAEVVDDSLYDVQPAHQSWSVGRHLCHIHNTRLFWLEQVSKSHAEGLPELFYQEDEAWHPVRDLAKIRSSLALSARAVGDAARGLFEDEASEAPPYENPVLFIQHMIWHEGWHVGLIMLGLRAAGKEPSEEWEEEHIWELWRGKEEWEE